MGEYRPVGDGAGPTARGDFPTATLFDGTAIPEKIGKYQIVRLIGQGSMGAVYEAMQDSPRRTVALKVIRSGVLSPRVLRRFFFETEVLGRLQHPNIAAIYDAGTAETVCGLQPYFAMELVSGESLTKFVTARDLPLKARIELLAVIADAVQYAHLKGIIHRDLKPGNILVIPGATPEAAPVPKILDFGLARATNADVHATTMQTEVGQILGTLAYMSPEQASGNPVDVDARADIYALGVVGYELLTGGLPFVLNDRPIYEALRIIQEDEPSRMSTVNRVLRGDVDLIVAKAMEKEKARRYVSAGDFAADLRRHLNDEPVTARPPSTFYSLSKFARRNKLLVGSAAIIGAMLVAGITATTWLSIVANQQRVKAEQAQILANENLTEAITARKQADESLAAAKAASKRSDDNFTAARQAIQALYAAGVQTNPQTGRIGATERDEEEAKRNRMTELRAAARRSYLLFIKDSGNDVTVLREYVDLLFEFAKPGPEGEPEHERLVDYADAAAKLETLVGQGGDQKDRLKLAWAYLRQGEIYDQPGFRRRNAVSSGVTEGHHTAEATALIAKAQQISDAEGAKTPNNPGCFKLYLRLLADGDDEPALAKLTKEEVDAALTKAKQVLAVNPADSETLVSMFTLQRIQADMTDDTQTRAVQLRATIATALKLRTLDASSLQIIPELLAITPDLDGLSAEINKALSGMPVEDPAYNTLVRQLTAALYLHERYDQAAPLADFHMAKLDGTNSDRNDPALYSRAPVTRFLEFIQASSELHAGRNAEAGKLLQQWCTEFHGEIKTRIDLYRAARLDVTVDDLASLGEAEISELMQANDEQWLCANKQIAAARQQTQAAVEEWAKVPNGAVKNMFTASAMFRRGAVELAAGNAAAAATARRTAFRDLEEFQPPAMLHVARMLAIQARESITPERQAYYRSAALEVLTPLAELGVLRSKALFKDLALGWMKSDPAFDNLLLLADRRVQETDARLNTALTLAPTDHAALMLAAMEKKKVNISGKITSAEWNLHETNLTIHLAHLDDKQLMVEATYLDVAPLFSKDQDLKATLGGNLMLKGIPTVGLVSGVSMPVTKDTFVDFEAPENAPAAVLAADDVTLGHSGQQRTIEGMVTTIFRAADDSTATLVFGDVGTDGVRVVLKDAKAFDKALGGDLRKALLLGTVRFSGTVQEVDGNPQIELATPAQLTVVKEPDPDKQAALAPETSQIEGPVIAGTDDARLAKSIGSVVTIRGKVVSGLWSSTGRVCTFRFDQDHPGGCIVIVFQARRKNFDAAFKGDVAANLVDATVEFSGPLKMFKNHPEILLDDPKQVRIVSAAAATTQPAR